MILTFFLALGFIFNAHAENLDQQILNFHQVTQNIYRGGRPNAKELSDLQKIGVKTILNLENDDDAVAEEKIVAQQLGLIYISTPMSAFYYPDDDTVNRAELVLNNPKNFPIFVHCKHGQDRTGLIIGLYRVKTQKWGARTAYDEMLQLGFHQILIFLDQYYRDKTGMPDLTRELN